MKISISELGAKVQTTFKATDSYQQLSTVKQGVAGPLERTPEQDSFNISIGYVNDAHGQTNNMI